MSIVSIRAAIETALNAITPAISTAWENSSFEPTAGTAYQRVFYRSQPLNPTAGTSRRQENGFVQVSLFYPLQTGTGAAAARAELIRTMFRRGYSFTSGGITVKIAQTPEIHQGKVDGDRWMLPVSIYFISDFLGA